MSPRSKRPGRRLLVLVVTALVVAGGLGPFVGLAAADSDDNDSIATADPATVGGTISGTLAFSEEDYYQFEAQADQRITLVGGMAAQTVPRILVQYYGPDGTTLGPAFTYTDVTAESGFIAPTTGTYYVRVETSYLGESAYSFAIGSEPVLDPYEPNAESAAATPLVAGSSYEAYRYYLDDDWYVYEATAGDATTISVTNTALAGDAFVQVGCPPIVGGASDCADTDLFLDSQFYAVSPGETRTVPVTATTDGAVYLLVYWGAALQPAEPVAEADGNPYRVDFSVAGDEPPAVDVTPSFLDFGAVPVDETAESFLTVSNAGGSDLTLDSVAVGGTDAEAFTVTTPPAPVVAPGASTTVGVTFAPTAAREYEAVLTVESDDPDTPTVPVALQGVGGGPDIEVDRAVVDFGSRAWSVELASLTAPEGAEVIRYRNVGTTPLRIDDVRLSGPDADAFFATRLDTGEVPPDGEYRVLLVSIRPPAPGTYEATLEIASNDPDEPVLTRPVRGTVPIQDIAVSATAIDFGPVPIAGGSATDQSTVENVGGWDLNVTSIRIEGDSLSEFDVTLSDGRFGTGTILVPRVDPRDLTVTYEPKRPLPASATLVIESDDPDEPRIEIALSGHGTLPNGNTPPGNGRP